MTSSKSGGVASRGRGKAAGSEGDTATTASPAASPVTTRLDATTEYLADIFRQARSCSRRLQDQREQLEDLIDAGKAEETYELRIEERTALCTVLATITPIALHRAADLARAMPDHVPVIWDLEGSALDRFMGPIFEEAGIGEDFMYPVGQA